LSVSGEKRGGDLGLGAIQKKKKGGKGRGGTSGYP